MRKKRVRGGATFKCTKCRKPTRVRRTVMGDRGVVRRERECVACGHRVNTEERKSG